MPWPALFFNLNPNLWGYLKQYVSNNSPTSKAQIWKVVEDVWAGIKRKTNLVLGQVEFCYYFFIAFH